MGKLIVKSINYSNFFPFELRNVLNDSIANGPNAGSTVSIKDTHHETVIWLALPHMLIKIKILFHL